MGEWGGEVKSAECVLWWLPYSTCEKGSLQHDDRVLMVGHVLDARRVTMEI